MVNMSDMEYETSLDNSYHVGIQAGMDMIAKDLLEQSGELYKLNHDSEAGTLRELAGQISAQASQYTEDHHGVEK